jgi:hypothetical protein
VGPGIYGGIGNNGLAGDEVVASLWGVWKGGGGGEGGGGVEGGGGGEDGVGVERGRRGGGGAGESGDRREVVGVKDMLSASWSASHRAALSHCHPLICRFLFF